MSRIHIHALHTAALSDSVNASTPLQPFLRLTEHLSLDLPQANLIHLLLILTLRLPVHHQLATLSALHTHSNHNSNITYKRISAFHPQMENDTRLRAVTHHALKHIHLLTMKHLLLSLK